jgi:HK97 family phage major capsid protein
MERLAERTRVLDTFDKAGALVHWTMCQALARRDPTLALVRFEQRVGSHSPHLEVARKSVVPPMQTTDEPWSADAALRPWTEAFLELIKPIEILSTIAPSTRRVPFNVRVSRTLTGSTAATFVAENALVPAVSATFDTLTLRIAKLAKIVVITRALAEHSTPSAVATIQRDLVRAIAWGVDTALFDSNAAVPQLRPAGLLNGVTATPGATLDAALGALWLAVSGGVSEAPFYVATPAVGERVSRARHTSGAALFPAAGPRGGEIGTVRLLTSPAAPADKLVLLDAAQLLVADDGVTLSASDDASVVMDDAPAGTTTMHSLFQQNDVGVQAARFVYWVKGRADAVGYVDVPAA